MARQTAIVAADTATTKRLDGDSSDAIDLPVVGERDAISHVHQWARLWPVHFCKPYADSARLWPAGLIAQYRAVPVPFSRHPG